MPPLKRIGLVFFIIAYDIGTLFSQQPKPPRLTVVIVIDQLAYHYLPKLEPYLQWGLKHIMRNGISYTNAYHPHAVPETATGHAALSTGTYPSDHGFVSNDWFDNAGNEVECDNDPSAPVFSVNNTLSKIGRSANNLMVDTLSDQCILSSTPSLQNQVFTISLKSRAAIAIAGKLGKAVWFDEDNGLFTSSKAYFEKLPDWVTTFNQEKRVDKLAAIPWKRFYRIKSPAYNFTLINDYETTKPKAGIIQRKFTSTKNEQKPYKLFKATPQANQALFDLTLECIDANLSPTRTDKLVIWLSLSPLDYAGHTFGPYSLETIDMIYHLDRQLNRFLQALGHRVKKSETLVVITADHGIEPIPELVQKQGFGARRILAKPLVEEMNKMVEKKSDVEKVLHGFLPSQFYLNSESFNSLTKENQHETLGSLKTYLKQQPGIKNVWTYDELASQQFEPNQLELLYKRQLYPGRSGQLICQPFPYCAITTYATGTDHSTPYEYNTHVPLILYQKKVWEKQVIHDPVSTLQFANTLAFILKVPKPSASTAPLLPGIATIRLSELTYA